MKCFRSKVSETSLENDKSKQQFAKIRDFSTKKIRGALELSLDVRTQLSTISIFRMDMDPNQPINWEISI